MTTTPSVSCCGFYIFSAPRPRQSTSSQLHLIPSPLVWAIWKCDASKAESNRKRHFAHVCVWSDFNVTPVKSPEEIAGSMSAPPLPSSVSASFNELFKPSINRRVLMHFTSVLRPMVFFHMCRNYCGGGGEEQIRHESQSSIAAIAEPIYGSVASRY